MQSQGKLPLVPASFFGIVLGLAGLGGSWRVAHRVWGLPAAFGEAILFVAALVWAILLFFYIAKWIAARDQAIAELNHPIQCCFVGLLGVASMLIAGAAMPYSRKLSVALFVISGIYTLAFAIWRTGGLWQGGRETSHSTAVLYLPTVAGSFVMAAVASSLGYADWAQLAFGAGFFSWLAIESVLINRLLTSEPLAVSVRPTLGIQLAPPTVGSLAYLSMDTPANSSVLVHAMFGYGLLQALVLIRLLPWIRSQPFSPGYWGFTFGVTALAAVPLRLAEIGERGPIVMLAPYLFGGANIILAVMTLGTLRLLACGTLLSPPAAAPLKS